MTPKEKAEELVGKYLEPNGIVLGLDVAKQCASLALDEIFFAIQDLPLDEVNWNYWQEVKQEIEKL